MGKFACLLLLLLVSACQSGHLTNGHLFINGVPGSDAAGVLDAVEESGDFEDFEEDPLEEQDAEQPELVAEIPGHRVKFELPIAAHPRVDYFVKGFSGPGFKGFKRRLERSGRYVPLMKETFSEEGLPQDLVYMALIESGFVEHAYSWAHAAGPWQFIEGTARIYGLSNDWWWDERRDPVKSTRAAARHLKSLYSQFDDWYLAVAAYNAGAGRIQNAIRRTGSRDFFELARRNHLPTETKNYVPKFLAALTIAHDPEKYGFTNLEYYAPLAFDVVTVETSTDLEVVARLCGSSYKKIKHFNPELKRWCTPPGEKNYRVKIPPGFQDAFEKSFAQLPVSERARFKRHRIQSGDTLGALAHRYKIRVQDIVTLNSIKDPRGLRIGGNILLPLKEGYTKFPADELKDDYQRTKRTVYRVRKGDSLWTISRKFNVGENNLRAWNALGSKNTIKPGQQLVVSKAGSSRKGQNPASRGHKVEYRVKSGDNLWDIGRTYGVGPGDIRKWNNLSSKQVLRPGDKLTLHVERNSSGKNVSLASAKSGQKVLYRVRRGDTLWGISRQFNIATSEIVSWNNISDRHVLRAGDTLTLHLEGNEKS